MHEREYNEHEHPSGYLLSIEQIPKGEPCAGAWRVKARPRYPHGYMFYAYSSADEATEVLSNLLQGSFDDQVYRVNFKSDNAQFMQKETSNDSTDIRDVAVRSIS